MLKKLLPWIKKPRNQVPEEPLETSGNLMSEQELLEEQIFFNNKTTSFFQLGIFIIYILFLGLFFYDSYLNTHLQNLKREQDALVSSVKSYPDLKEDAAELAEIINYYKNSVESREYLGAKLKLVKDIPGSITIRSFNIDSSGFNILAEGPSVSPFTNMIINYLNTREISQIQISSATYEKNQDLYKVLLNGEF